MTWLRQEDGAYLGSIGRPTGYIVGESDHPSHRNGLIAIVALPGDPVGTQRAALLVSARSAPESAGVSVQITSPIGPTASILTDLDRSDFLRVPPVVSGVRARRASLSVAQIGGAGGGLFYQNTDDIQSVTRNAAGVYTINYFFSAASRIGMVTNWGFPSGGTGCQVIGATATTMQVASFNTAGVAADSLLLVYCYTEYP